MPPEDEKTGASSHDSESSTPPEKIPSGGGVSDQAGHVSYSQTVDDPYASHDDPYGYDVNTGPVEVASAPVESSPDVPPPAVVKGPPPPPPPPPPKDPEDEEEDGMLRMSFMEHLEDLRKRLIMMVIGLVVAFVICLTFSEQLWKVISEPAISALRELKVPNPTLVMLSPMDGFTIIWMKLPLLCSIFVASPWILWQMWLFIAPGLYKKERRYAAPFVIFSAGLFITGGLFAYFVAFRFGLTFLLGIGFGDGVTPFVSIVEYFDLFVNIILGIGLVFELPILVFLLTLLRVASPSFLLRHSRYAILAITILAAIVTPTPDVFNLMLFAVPMVMLYFLGVFASYLLVLKRENKRFPWKAFSLYVGIALLLIGIALFIAIYRYHFKVVLHSPFLVR